MSMSNCPKCWETPCRCGHEYREWTVEKLKEQIKMLEEVMFFKQYKLPELQPNENLQCIVIIQKTLPFPDALPVVVGHWMVYKRNAQGNATFKVFRDERHIHTGAVSVLQRGGEPAVIICDEQDHVLLLEDFSDLKVGDLLVVISEGNEATEDVANKETQTETFRLPALTERFHSSWDAIEDNKEQIAELERRRQLLMRVRRVLPSYNPEMLQNRFGVSPTLIENVTLARFNDIAHEDLVELAKLLSVNLE